MRIARAVTLCAALIVMPFAAFAATRCPDQPGDAAQIEAARAEIDGDCPCFSFAKHSAYTQCAARVVNAHVLAGTLRKGCKGLVQTIQEQSVCGRSMTRRGPFTPCVHTDQRSGKVTCAIKSFCRGLREFQTCQHGTTCVDAADTDGDLRIVAPGDDGRCVLHDTFTDNGDGTITDSRSGLVWEKQSDDGSIHDKDNLFAWLDAPDHIAALNAAVFAGHSDWRLPTVAELQTLVVFDPVGPLGGATVSHEFNAGCTPGCSVTTCSCTRPALYWSSTPVKNTDQAWSVSFHSGSALYTSTGPPLLVRSVRTAQ